MSALTVRQRSLPSELPELGLPLLLTRVLAARGITSIDECDLSLKQLLPPALGGLDAGVELLLGALEQRHKIVVVGDFDADGATSTALLISVLREMGEVDIDFLVPSRTQGYGLTSAIVEQLLPSQPKLLITVDNGISSVGAVALARQHGIKVLITDHHLPGQQLPAADAIINPNLRDEPFPSKSLAGVGVVFYLLMALRARLRQLDWFARHQLPEPNLAHHLDLVALGTVADVVPLDRNNRILVEQGLRRIRAGLARPGIRALLQVSGREPTQLVSSDLGFALGPRLNAAGRIDTMSIGIQCLLSKSEEEAQPLAQQLDELNRQRRSIESEMQAEAAQILAQLVDLKHKELPAGVCLFQPHWHQGVVGIVAGRVKDQLHRPVIVFAANEEDEQSLKGSARSIPGVHIRDVIEQVATLNPGLIDHFGGHAMAAGLNLSADNLTRFRAAFAEQVERVLGGVLPGKELLTDGELAMDEFELGLADQLRYLAPWGQHFAAPTFSGRFEVLHQRHLQGRHWKLKLQAENGFESLDAILFNHPDELPLKEGIWLDLVYQLDVNHFRGKQSLQLMIEAVL